MGALKARLAAEGAEGPRNPADAVAARYIVLRLRADDIVRRPAPTPRIRLDREFDAAMNELGFPNPAASTPEVLTPATVHTVPRVGGGAAPKPRTERAPHEVVVTRPTAGDVHVRGVEESPEAAVRSAWFQLARTWFQDAALDAARHLGPDASPAELREALRRTLRQASGRLGAWDEASLSVTTTVPRSPTGGARPPAVPAAFSTRPARHTVRASNASVVSRRWVHRRADSLTVSYSFAEAVDALVVLATDALLGNARQRAFHELWRSEDARQRLILAPEMALELPRCGPAPADAAAGRPTAPVACMSPGDLPPNRWSPAVAQALVQLFP